MLGQHYVGKKPRYILVCCNTRHSHSFLFSMGASAASRSSGLAQMECVRPAQSAQLCDSVDAPLLCRRLKHPSRHVQDPSLLDRHEPSLRQAQCSSYRLHTQQQEDAAQVGCGLPAPRAIESLNERLDPDDVSLRTLSGVRAVKCARLIALGEAAHRGANERASNNNRLWVNTALHVLNQYGNGILTFTSYLGY